jgi:hypothetical protein
MPSVDARKTVLFFDDQGWDSFEQVAVGMRRRGIRAIRLVTGPPARFQRLLAEPHLRWLADRLFYDELIHIGSEEGRARLQALLDTGVVADVIANEPALLELGLDAPLCRALTSRALAFHGTPPQTLLDKFAVNEALKAVGVATPRQIRVRGATPAQAAARLGLPLWIKHPVGASGERVRGARSLADIARGLHDLGEDEDLFYQEHVPGKVVVYGAVVGAGGPIMEHGFRIERAQREGGPAAEATLYDEPALLAAGRRATALFGPRGFVSFGFVEAPDGRMLHIDANIRPWGMISAPLSLGLDFARAYADFVLDRPPTLRAPRTAPPRPLPIFPHRVLAPARAGNARAAISGAGALMKTFAGRLGLSYCGYVLARAPLLAVRGMRERRAGAARAPAPLAHAASQRENAASSA